MLNSDIEMHGKKLRALPTRDAVIVILGILLLAKQQGRKISELAARLPARFTASLDAAAVGIRKLRGLRGRSG